MNILLGILKYPPDYAGDGLRLHKTFQRLKSKGHINEVYVLTSWDHDTHKQNNNLNGIKIFRPAEYSLKEKYKKFGRLFKKIIIPFEIFKIIQTYFSLYQKIDVVLTSGSGWLPSIVGWLALFSKKPLVKEIVLLGSDDPMTLSKRKSFWTRWFFLLPFHFSKLLIAISPAVENSCLKYGILQEKIWCRFNPVDFKVDPEIEHKGYPANQIPLILWVGIIHERKNVEFLLRAACHLKQPVQICFVGPCHDSGYFKKLEQIRKEIPGFVKILFLGQIDDRERLKHLYLKAKLFWFASKSEGMGNVVAESLSCGTPVVTLPVMGIMKQVIPTPEDGEVVETTSSREFARVVSKWLQKETNRLEISKRARERFNAEEVDNGYVLRFEDILNRRKTENESRISELILERSN